MGDSSDELIPNISSTEQDEIHAFPPGKPLCINVSGNCMSISWQQPTFVPTHFHYEVNYKENNTYVTQWKSFSTSDNKASLQNLKCNTGYIYKVRLVCDCKAGPFSESGDPIKTLSNPTTVLSQVENPVASATTTNSISIKWDTREVMNNPVDYYEIKYKIGDTAVKRWCSTSTEGNETMVTIKDLRENTRYDFKIRTVIGNVEGPFSEVITICTRKNEYKPPSIPEEISATASDISLQWNNTESDFKDLSRYEVVYRRTNQAENWKSVFTKGAENNIIIEHLEPKTEYEFKVKTIYKSDVQGPFSEPSVKLLTRSVEEITGNTFQRFSSDRPDQGIKTHLKGATSKVDTRLKKSTSRTSSISPQQQASKKLANSSKSTKPGKPTVKNKTSSSVQLKWSTGNLETSTIKHHEVQFRECSDNKWNTNSTRSFKNDITVSNLKPSTKYVFKVRSNLNDRLTPFSELSEDIRTLPHTVELVKQIKESHDRMTISWPRPDCDDVNYIISYKSRGLKKWKMTKSTENQIELGGLEESTEYEIKIKSETNEECGHESVTFFFRTGNKLNGKCPGKPRKHESTSSSITLVWDKGLLERFDCYEIRYRAYTEQNRADWNSIRTDGKNELFKVEHLKGGTNYVFMVAPVIDGLIGPFSEESEQVQTMLTYAQCIELDPDYVRYVRYKEGSPKIYKLPLKVITQDKRAKTRTCEIDLGMFRGDKKPYKPSTTRLKKNIILFGATGSGKSTLIEGMINYITGVSWKDDFRFSIVYLTDEELQRVGDQTLSQTEWITTYKIPFVHEDFNYAINIIDTPGFLDTQGVVRDKEIITQVKYLFNSKGDDGIQTVDAICVVTPSSSVRLTGPQRYIFDSIFAIFGADIKKNILVLVTFADASTPPVLDALNKANIPFDKHFSFNNSALFNDQKANKNAQLFWEMGTNSFKEFFNYLKSLRAQSLQLTSEVLHTRDVLQAAVEGLQKQISDGMNQMTTMRKEGRLLKRHKTEIEANQNFEYEVEEAVMTEIQLKIGEYTTNCIKCNMTCHFPCFIPDDKNKRKCAAMWPEGNCRACPNECAWYQHKNARFKLETVIKNVKKTYETVKEKYNIAQKEAMDQVAVLKQMKNAFQELRKDVFRKIRRVKECIDDLDKIALKTNPLSDIAYIDLLIQAEKTELRCDWEERVKLLEHFRKDAKLMKEVKQDRYEPLDAADEILKEFEIDI